MSFIEIKDLYFSYDDDSVTGALNGISLSVEKGEFLAVLGRNGSGKSTLAKLLAMVLEANSGSITIDGDRITGDMSDDDIINIRRKIGIVFQNPDDQLVATVVEEDIAFGPENLGVEPSEIRKRVDAALAKVGMSEYAKHAPNRLSGGQKQRIAIAGVIVMSPECVIFDESTAMLDPSGQREIMKLVSEINQSGVTVICITHNMSEAAMADRIVVLDGGKITMQGTPREVFANPSAIEAAGLEVPEPAKLAYELEECKVALGGMALSEDELVEKVLNVYNNK